MPMAEERRIIPRRPVLKAGSISFGGGAIDRTIRNISDAGATLEVVAHHCSSLTGSNWSSNLTA
jgi:hypothetical protein